MKSGRCYFWPPFITSFLCYFQFLAAPSSAIHSLPPLLGVHPLDERYFAPAVINCNDGSNSFSRDRLNDDFCDCVDGTDEPGTSACPRGKFYCRNVGSTPKFIFSSRVNDQVCAYDEDIDCVGFARVRSEDQMIVAGPMKQLLSIDFGSPLHFLVITGKTHPLEEEMLDIYRLKTSNDSDKKDDKSV